MTLAKQGSCQPDQQFAWRRCGHRTRRRDSRQSEPARRVLAQCFAEWQSYLSEGFKAMRDNGELAAKADPAELALTVMSAPAGRTAHGPGDAQCPSAGVRPEHGTPAHGRIPAAPRQAGQR